MPLKLGQPALQPDPFEEFVGIPLKFVIPFNHDQQLFSDSSSFVSSPLSFLVEKHHLNGQGSLHGGMISTFIDYASCAAVMVVSNSRKKDNQLYHVVTLNLAVNFVSAGNLGDLIVAEIDVCRETRSTYFCRATVKAKRQVNDQKTETVVAMGQAIVRAIKIPNQTNPLSIASKL